MKRKNLEISINSFIIFFFCFASATQSLKAAEPDRLQKIFEVPDSVYNFWKFITLQREGSLQSIGVANFSGADTVSDADDRWVARQEEEYRQYWIKPGFDWLDAYNKDQSKDAPRVEVRNSNYVPLHFPGDYLGHYNGGCRMDADGTANRYFSDLVTFWIDDLELSQNQDQSLNVKIHRSDVKERLVEKEEQLKERGFIYDEVLSSGKRVHRTLPEVLELISDYFSGFEILNNKDEAKNQSYLVVYYAYEYQKEREVRRVELSAENDPSKLIDPALIPAGGIAKIYGKRADGTRAGIISKQGATGTNGKAVLHIQGAQNIFNKLDERVFLSVSFGALGSKNECILQKKAP